MSPKEKLDILLKWFDDSEIEWDKENLDIRITDNSFGVFAANDVKKKKNPIVRIPKEVILSPKSTGIANILEDENIEGGCSLAISIMYEFSQGTESPWYGYLQSLPASEDLPIFWESEKELLKGTEMEHAIRNDLKDLKEDYSQIVQPLLEKYPYIFSADHSEHFSFDTFCRISTLVSSRSFEVDAYHGNAMVPFADVFNHRSGNNEHVHFETDFDVCDACGALDYCEHQYLEDLENGSDAESGEDGWEDEEDDEGEKDEMSESGSEKSDEDDSEEEEEEGSLVDLEELEKSGVNFWEEEDDKDKKDTCDMVLSRPLRKGDEVFNTYGDHPSIALLGKYGFCHDDNKNDYVSISEDTVIDACIAITTEIIRAEGVKGDEKALEQQAIERTRPRWEFFLMNEHILCPSKSEDGEDDFEEDEEHEHGGGCCGGDDDEHDHDHGHGHEHEDEHDHDHEHGGGCCGDEHDEEDDDEQRGRPYFVNVEGLYEDTLTCLLHVMFVDTKLFETFAENVEAAVKYFEELADESGKKANKDVKTRVYQVCHALSEHRRLEYLDEQQNWVPIEQDIAAREKAKNKREYYALTCRINEKKIVEKSVAYYDSMIKSCNVEKKSSKKKSKKMKL
ncbi:hypothetical protein DFQ28_009086 [Apophysomyces sp. BC1034]|nr:hypothetical protein DFQ30_008832 [Apophysomyces sp. BC1015]KAG0173775.1 hypothetical protein DFQ29_007764 [Apophysomyces sp. BC1021]KAG0185611.1 hypothetical protein DFQ28_009086 [Apophysomyces sp. BC1034]